ncbi:MAG: DUF2809 domain-containing protein [Glaciihabitans sp.]
MPSAAAPAEPDSPPRSDAGEPLRRRLWMAGCAAAAIVVGLAIHSAMPGAAGDFLADAAYAVLIYLLVAALAPRHGSAAVLVTSVAICFAIELAQLSDIPLRLAEAVPPAALVFGTTFAGKDLIAYLIGGMLVAGIDSAVRWAGRNRHVS